MDEQQKPMVSPITLFYSYAHEDELLRNELEKHLSLLRRQGLITEWHDRQILAGEEWARDIDQHLETASIILLLISPDFLASDYCYDIEMLRALERHKRGEARVIPIILRPCDWRTSPFAHLQCLPRDGKAVTTSQNLDEALLAIADGLRRVIEQGQIPARPLPAVERRNRILLLKQVHAIWIEGVVKNSLHQAALLALDLQERPDALANPFLFEVQETNLPPRLLAAGTSITQVYREADGALLILGEPGAGKSTLLLELARTLLEQAAQEEHFPMPVVFNLTSWAQKRVGLAEWLIEELWLKYQVQRSVGKAWVEADLILPLLDGLDEVAAANRPECVQAINTYSQQHRGSPLVVCCRTAEYYAQATRVRINKAVVVQPLTAQQIELYLNSAQGKQEGLRRMLQQDEGVRALATTPLMLSILTLAYHDTIPTGLDPTASQQELRTTVFSTYVTRMLRHRGRLRTAASEKDFRERLTFLASQMQCHHQDELLLEQMQPDWLVDTRMRRRYRLSKGLVFGLPLGLLFGLFVFVGLRAGPLLGLGTGLGFGLLLVALLSRVNAERISPAERLTWSWKKAWLGMWVWGARTFASHPFGLSENQLIERTHLSPNEGIWRSAKNGLVVGLIFGLIFGSLVGLSGAPLLALVGLAGLRYVGGGALVGLVVGLIFGVSFGLRFGLRAFLEHFLLRLFFWRMRCLPWNLVPFLDEAAERLLLRKVGGGYIFVHHLLLDYFASLEKEES